MTERGTIAFAEGASASLNKTITAIERFLEDAGARPANGLRAYMQERLGDLAVKWYRRGFKRGHMETQKQSTNGKLPRALTYEVTREFFTGDERTVHLKSALSRKNKKR